MPTQAVPMPVPVRRSDLVLSAPDRDGGIVVKDPRTGKYFGLGAQEAFLLSHLDGSQSAEAVCTAFTNRFAESLSAEELDEFLKVARDKDLLQTPEGKKPPRETVEEDVDDDEITNLTGKGERFNILNWRISLVDPDRLFTWLAPKLGFLWTPCFVILSLAGVFWALCLLALNWPEYTAHTLESLTWETLALAYIVLFVVTTLHEFAHGLTCKRHGGEVHEIGFLMMLLMPCFYCNVSDAWLIRDKSKRLWVTLAGGYCDLCMWALAVFVWCVALPGTLPYRLAWVVMSICGIRVFLNFMPLIRLDGYYLLSDWVEIPNLRRRASDYLTANVRWLLWGAKRPEPQARGLFLLAYGAASWLFVLFYGVVLLVALIHISWPATGLVRAGQLALVGWLLLPRLLSGFFRGEVTKMFMYRHKRLLIWATVLGALVALLVFVPMPDRAGGHFKIRPATRAELRAPVPGFLQLVYLDERHQVSPGTMIACLEIPDLFSKAAQKGAELKESQAKLTLLEAGTRPEALLEQRDKVQRATVWHELAKQDLDRKQKAMAEELSRLTKQVSQARSQLDFALEAQDRGKKLLEGRALSLDQYRDLEKTTMVHQSLYDQAEARKNERVTIGMLEQENELAKRSKDLADAQGILKLMEAGTRPEEIQAEKARLSRLQEEKNYLETLKEKIRLTSPISGIIVTPRLREKIGQYFKEGDLICEIEEQSILEAEIPMEEQVVAKVKPGQEVEFKARSLPWTPFKGTVSGIAPLAIQDKLQVTKVQNTLTVTCKLTDPPAALCSGMTGYARVSCGSCSLGTYLFGGLLRYVRTEFWW